MANVRAIHSVGSSIVTFLRNAYPQSIDGVAMPTCSFELVSGGQLIGEQAEATRITLHLYRVTVNEHSRQGRPPGAASTSPPSLGLDLHYLLTAWGANPLDEQVPLAWAMRRLHTAPVLDRSILSADGGWGRDETVQVLPADLATEDLMRIWDALEPPYRPSSAYIARVVRLDPDGDDEQHRRVVAIRESFGVEVGP